MWEKYEKKNLSRVLKTIKNVRTKSCYKGDIKTIKTRRNYLCTSWVILYIENWSQFINKLKSIS